MITQKIAGVPIFSIKGIRGRGQTALLIRHILIHAGYSVRVVNHDTSQPVFSDPSVDINILSTPHGEWIHFGDICIITDYQAHVWEDEEDNEETEDIRLEYLVSKQIREGGTLILNADDLHVTRVAQLPQTNDLHKKNVFYSLSSNNLVLRNHISRGGLGYFPSRNWIMEASYEIEYPLIRVSDVMSCMNVTGDDEFIIRNTLAAVAALRIYGISKDQLMAAISYKIKTPAALRTFRIKL